MGSFIEAHSRQVFYDGHPKDVAQPLTYVMHDHKRFADFDFNYGSVIFDPFRKTNQTEDLTQRGIIVYNYGDTVGIPMYARNDPGRL